MKELGQFLREKREEKKVSLEEVSVSTKISIKILEAIEDGDLKRLPAKPFVRGFIQSYARYLGLDVREILTRFQEAVGSTRPEMPINLPQTGNLEKNLPGSGRRLIKVVGIFILILGIIVIQRLIAKKETEMKSGEVQAITGNDSPVNIMPSATPFASAAASASESVASPSSTSSPITSSPSPSPSLSQSPSPSPSPSPSASPSPSPSAEPISSAGALAPSPVSQPSPSQIEAMGPQEVIVEALDHVVIRITIDAKPTQEITLNPDQIQTFKAKGKLKLYTPNGGAISVIHNGHDLGVPGNLGQPKLMVFPK